MGWLVADEGRKIPLAVFCEHGLVSTVVREWSGVRVEDRRTTSGLNRWTRTRSKSGRTDLMDLNVAWAACAAQDCQYARPGFSEGAAYHWEKVV